jgi:predicted transcriptional regulator
MSIYLEKYKQNIAVDMRKRGLSYSEIGNKLHIPKSTLSYWLKNLKLTPEQIKKLNDKRVEITKTNALKKISRTSKMIEEIKSSSSQDIKEISKKELWLMGVMLYWKNGNKSDLKKGVHFSSSDPYMIKLFLKWLKEAGGIKDGEIKFEIFLKNNGNDKNEFKEKAVNYWSDVTGFPKTDFQKNYFQKTNKKQLGLKYGFLRVKVAQSSMLARQIAGWIEGLKNINNLE